MPTKPTPNSTAQTAIFQEKTIRCTWHNDQWWFAIMDVIVAVTGSVQPKGYAKDLRRRNSILAKDWREIAIPLMLQTTSGVQPVNCANMKGLQRILQSMPSRKTGPFKRWLAQVGLDKIQEIENPELVGATARDLDQADVTGADVVQLPGEGSKLVGTDGLAAQAQVTSGIIGA